MSRRPSFERPPRTRQTDTSTEFWAEFLADYWLLLVCIVLFFVLAIFLAYLYDEAETTSFEAKIKAHFGLIICSMFVFMISVIAYYFYQNGLPGTLKDIKDSSIIRNYFLIFAASASTPFLVWRAIIANRNADTNRHNQVTQAYSTAIGQLGSINLNGDANNETRLGAVYTLEKIALLNKDYHQSVIKILASYVRQNSSNEKDENKKIDIITQTILTTISKIKIVFGKKDIPIDLKNCNLRGADLWRADLRDADLRNTDLRDADLKGADLRYADLEGADLEGADLFHLKISIFAKFPKGYREQANRWDFQEYDEFTGKWIDAVK